MSFTLCAYKSYAGTGTRRSACSTEILTKKGDFGREPYNTQRFKGSLVRCVCVCVAIRHTSANHCYVNVYSGAVRARSEGAVRVPTPFLEAMLTPASDYQIRQVVKPFSGGPYVSITEPTAPCKAL